jgi:hypothetical protein
MMALPFTLECILRQKEDLWKLKYFTMQKYNLKKKHSQRNQNPSRLIIITLITNLKFQHKPKYIIFQKSSYNKNRPIIIIIIFQILVE